VTDQSTPNPEQERLADPTLWRHWGPYLSERAWGTVREDYSADGQAWTYFPHDHARSRAYRWNEDGLAGISDEHGNLCFALALWNGQDPILKERLFGLSGPEGNHGEDCKECYYFLDNTPTHSYQKMLYKYPQAAYPYGQLIEANGRRGRSDPEFELVDIGIFDQSRYFDVLVEYAKAAPEDVCIRITVTNRGPDAAPLTLLPTLWFRNTWSWGRHAIRPSMSADSIDSAVIRASHSTLGEYRLDCEGVDSLLFTENETNLARLYGTSGPAYCKDAFHEYVIGGRTDAINPAQVGTKAAALYRTSIAPSELVTLRLRLSKVDASVNRAQFADFDAVFAARIEEADRFYTALQPAQLDHELAQVQRQAFAGMLWSKQFYHYNVAEWLEGDPAQPPPPQNRRDGRNREWEHLNNSEVISMPDSWEYPWYAAWDLAFHCIPLAHLDPAFAKDQLILILREWYQHPNGQVPAYEWTFSDVNPPVLAWAALRVYEIDCARSGTPDVDFLKRMFHKLLINFTWWVNRKDAEGRNVFQGGFLGLDNIGVFDRSASLPTGGHLDQSDGTSWMGMFSLNMMRMALELAAHDHVYEDIATKFFEHFLYIAAAMNDMGQAGIALWDEQDQFFYDVLRTPDGGAFPLRVRSLCSLIPLLAVEVLDSESLMQVPGFKLRLEWFLANRPHLARLVSRWQEAGDCETQLFALVRGHRLKQVLKRMLDPAEFLSEYGIRSLSKAHVAQPFTLVHDGTTYSVGYEPAESQSALFGGNSNWRGPIWFPINYLLIEALRKFHSYFGDEFIVEHPTGSGNYQTLEQIANDLTLRLTRLFMKAADGARPFNGGAALFQSDPHFRDYMLFYEYFNADTGAGLGASHQTGWTGLIADLIQRP